MFTICKRTLDEQGNAADTALTSCIFKQESDAVSYLDKVTQFLWPDAGYEGERNCWWVRNNDLITYFTIKS